MKMILKFERTVNKFKPFAFKTSEQMAEAKKILEIFLKVKNFRKIKQEFLHRTANI